MGNPNFFRTLSVVTGVVVGLAALKLALASRMPRADAPGVANAPTTIFPVQPPDPPKLYVAVREDQPDTQIQSIVQQYVDRLAATGVDPNAQGIWVQSGDRLLAEHQGKTRLPAASLTKLATTLTALDRWDPNYKFITRIGIRGTVQDGVLNGDLVFFGGADPMFVWESAIAVGNSLNKLGIREVTGNLLVTGVFVMNFDRDRDAATELLRQGLDSSIWGWEAAQQYATLPAGTAKPEVKIRGQALGVNDIDKATTPIVAEHHSFALQELLKRMNMYSNNDMAQLLSDLLGGPTMMKSAVERVAGVPASEVEFINGSGLGEENQLSPRAACRILDVIGHQLNPHQLGLRDVLPIVPVDRGTLEDRNLPSGLIGKTGTLATVSNLAGVLPIASQPALSLEQPDSVCFAIQNYGSDLDYFYRQQEAVVSALNDAKLTAAVQAAEQVSQVTPAQ